MLRRVFMRDVLIESINIGTDARVGSEGNISTIEIAIIHK
jgi:DNA-binding protein